MTERATAQIEIDYLRDEVAKLKEKLKDESTARAFLSSKGYYTENLWCLEDVTQNYHCTQEEARNVLSMAMTNEAIMEQIFLSIEYAADCLAIRRKDD
jgi:NAD(P)H-dependent flavin oxidoreductase YrpB (nitropropane dioxygenase family)